MQQRPLSASSLQRHLPVPVFLLLLVGATIRTTAAPSLPTPKRGTGVTVFIGMPAKAALETAQETSRVVQILAPPAADASEPGLQDNSNQDLPGNGGRTTVVTHTPGYLPYADGIVNTIILTGPQTPPRDELMRVLAPRGTLVAADGRRESKPWPSEIDEWTHILHDATNNAVAEDTVVAPPDSLRWIGSPDHCRHHNFFASVSSMVSAGGRLFTVADEGPLLSEFLPPDWTLTAQDAFNGATLWKRKLTDWSPNLRDFRSGPAEIGRRLVAINDKVYVTLGFDAPVSVLDAATGKELAVLPESKGAEEILVTDDVVLITAGDPKAELQDWAYANRQFASGQKHGRRLVAVDAASGKLKWQRKDEQTATILPMTLAVEHGRAFFVNAKGMAAIDLATGKQLWETEEAIAMIRRSRYSSTVVAHAGVVLYADRVLTKDEADAFYSERPKKYQARYRELWAYPSRLRAYDAETGKRLWGVPAGESFHTPTDIMVIDNTVWYTVSPAMLEGNFKTGRDLRTGKVIKTIDGPDIRHGRCYRNKATSRFLLGGKDGLDFIDPLSKESRYVSHGMRGTCQLGVLPCNGLVYLPPHACTCEATRKLNGFFAMAQNTRRPYPDPSRFGPRLHSGPAADAAAKPQADGANSAEDWPTFRHDAARTGSASTTLPEKLEVLWKRPIGQRPTAPVCTGGTLYVAAREEHTLWALDAATGKPTWKYQTGGRIDSPPTVDSGLVLFGCRDGWLRCLRATDGALIWRFRAAPEERQVVVKDQFESVWPLHGATLVRDGKVYTAAGRGSIIDGGVTVFCLDMNSGKLLAQKPYPDPNTPPDKERQKRNPWGGDPANDALLDVLSFAEGCVTMRHQCLTPDLKPAEPVPHVQSATGLLDDNYFHRSYWAYDKRVNRTITGNKAPSGHILTIDNTTAYAYGRTRESYLGHIKGFERHLYAADLRPQQVKLEPEKRTPKREGRFKRVIAKYTKKGIAVKWSHQIPMVVKGMTVVGDQLLVAGPPFDLHPSHFLVDPTTTPAVRLDTAPKDPNAAEPVIEAAYTGLRGDRGAGLQVLTKSTGEALAQYPLPSVPVFDGMIAARGRVYICTEDGTVTCLGQR